MPNIDKIFNTDKQWITNKLFKMFELFKMFNMFVESNGNNFDKRRTQSPRCTAKKARLEGGQS